MNKKQLIYSIVTLFLLGLIVSSGTYAYYSFIASNNKNISFNTSKELENYVIYNEGESKFSGDFKVSSTYTQGMHSTISLYKTSAASNVDLIATIKMDINEIGSNIKNSTALKWVVTSGTSTDTGSVLAQGNFIGVNNGDTLTLVPNIEVTTTETFYTIWIWLDENGNPSDELTGETLDVNVWTEINQVEGIDDSFEITRINANYQEINATIVNNKNKVVGYAITTTNTEPDEWTSIDATNQSNVYNLDYSVLETGTYYVWIKDSEGNTISRSIEVTQIDMTAPVCTWGTFTDNPIQNNTTSEIVLTCIDNESEITINNLKVDNIITSNSNITVMSIARATQSNGYKYSITVKGTANDGETTLTLPANTIKNAMGLGNEVKTSSAITVANTYTVKYQTGNSACSLNTTTYKDYEATYGTAFNIANPSCSGYTFQGWTANSGLDTTNAKYGTSSSAVTTTWSNASTKVTATWFNNLAKRDTKEVTLTANWSDSTKPVCTVSTPSSISYGSTTTVTVTCTDNAAMSSQTLTTSNFTSSNTGVATVQSVSNPTAVTNGYKYTVTMKGVGVGSYTLSINANAITDSTGNKNDKATSSNGTVTAKSLTPSINTCTSKTYDGKTNATCTLSLATIESGDTVTASGTCTFDDKNVGNNKTVSCSSISLSGTNASKYTLSLTSASKTSAANITAFTPTVSLTAKSAAYTGSAINANTATVTLTNSETYSGTITYTYYTNNACSTGATTTAPTSGTWYVKASIAASGNYNAASSGCVNHTIIAATPTVSLSAKTGMTYNGSSQAANTATVSPNGGGAVTYTYYTNNACSAGATTTAPTNVGNYWVKASVAEVSGKTNAATSSCVAHTISAKSVAVTWGTTTSFAYTGSAQAPTASATSGVSGETINVTRTTQTNVGSYTSTASCSSVSGGQAKCSNYTLTGTTKAYSITAVAATCPTISDWTGTYDGAQHSIQVSGGSGGTVQYKWNSTSDSWRNTIPTASIAGSWKVYVQVAADANHTTVDCGYKTLTITKYTPTITLSATTGTVNYNAETTFNATPTVIDACKGTLTAVSASTSNVTISSGGSTANATSAVTVKWKGVAYTTDTKINVNYTPSNTSNCNSATQKQYTAKVNRINQTVSLTAKSATYSGSAIAANTATTTGNGSLSYVYYTNNTCTTQTGTTAATGGAASAGAAPKYVGTWYVKATAAQTGQYNSASSSCVTHTITKYTPSIALSATSGSVNENATATFTATPTVIAACKGTLTATSASTTYVTITGGASTSNATSAVTVTYKGIKYSTGTKINVNYATGDTTNCNNATQKQFTASVADKTAPTGSVSATMNNLAISATASVSDAGIGLSGTYYWKVSTSSTCNSSTTGFVSNTSTTYTFNASSNAIYYVCLKVGDKSNNYGYFTTSVTPKVYLTNLSTATEYFKNTTYISKISSVKFSNSISNSGAVNSWDLSENKDNSIIGWLKANTSNTSRYDLIIGSPYKIYSKNLHFAFRNLTLTSDINLSGLNTSETTDMSGMFMNVHGENEINFKLNFGNDFDTKNVTNMQQMFYSVATLSSDVNITFPDKFDAGNVTKMYAFFQGSSTKANSVKINFGNNFNASKVTNITGLFKQFAARANYIDINLGNNFNVTNITDMSANSGMFGNVNMGGTKDLKIDFGKNFNAIRVTNVDGMFYNIGNKVMNNLTINLGNNFNASNLTNMTRMFDWIAYFTPSSNKIIDIELGNNFNANIINDATWAFRSIGSTTGGIKSCTVNLGNNFNTSNMTTMAGMFYGTCAGAGQSNIYLGNKFYTNKVTNMWQMFDSAMRNATVINFSFGDYFNTTKVTNMQQMFYYFASNVSNLNLNLSFMNTINVTTMGQMFTSLGLNSTSLNLNLGSNFYTQKASSFGYMFENIGRNATNYSLNLGSKFNTSNSGNFWNMFSNSGQNATNFNFNMGSSAINLNLGNTNTVSIFQNFGNKSSKSFVLNLAGGTIPTMMTNLNVFSGISPKAIIHVKDSASQQWIISRNNLWGTSFSASNVLIK